MWEDQQGLLDDLVGVGDVLRERGTAELRREKQEVKAFASRRRRGEGKAARRWSEAKLHA